MVKTLNKLLACRCFVKANVAISSWLNRNVFLELGKSKNNPGIAAALKNALGDKGSIRALDPKSSDEIQDLDGLSSKSEASGIIKKSVPKLSGETEGLKVWVTKPNRSQQQMAVAKMGEKHANKLLSLQNLKVGYQLQAQTESG